MFLISPPGVYRPQSDTAVLSARLAQDGVAGCSVLDVGTGGGAVAIAAHQAGAASVTAVDLSLRSVLAARLNARLRGASVAVARGDLFDPVAGRRFDVIVANPPYVPAPTETLRRFGISRCWDAGLDGRALLDRFCDDAPQHLNPDGRVLIVHSAVCGADETVLRLAKGGLAADVVGRTTIPFGPVMRARAAMLEARGLIEPGATLEELVVIGARRAR